MHTENKQSAVDLGEFLDRLYRYAMVLSRSGTEGEDLVQETCLRIPSHHDIVSGSKELVISSSYLVGSKIPRKNHITTTIPSDSSGVFNTRFSRYRRLLRFIAIRVLGGSERADEAVGNCWISASRNPPWFKHEGAFRSWLFRILIDEALAIRGQAIQTAGIRTGA